MAGDWIKMRGELWTHPRFLALSNRLIYGDSDGGNVGFLRYVCGDALDTPHDRHESITDKALHIITKRALRDVTMSALLRVWCAVNAHGKVEGSNALLAPMGLADLDEMAGFRGFGDALVAVDWVAEDKARSALVFLNFLEHNEPASMRKSPLTNAERQRLYRERRKASAEGVTARNESNDREDKRRGEIKKDDSLTAVVSPLTPLVSENQESQDKTSARNPRARGTRLARNWSLPDEWRAWTAHKRPDLTPAAVDRIAESFRDYWIALSGEKAVKLDWFATWRNWVRKEPTRPSQRGDLGAASKAAIAEAVRRRNAREGRQC